jgi:hypothetical protein
MALGAVLLAGCSSSPQCDQCEDCKDFLACSYKMGVRPGTYDSTYGPNGSCWETTMSSDKCTLDCRNLNTALKSSGVGADAGCTFGI